MVFLEIDLFAHHVAGEHVLALTHSRARSNGEPSSTNDQSRDERSSVRRQSHCSAPQRSGLSRAPKARRAALARSVPVTLFHLVASTHRSSARARACVALLCTAFKAELLPRAQAQVHDRNAAVEAANAAYIAEQVCFVLSLLLSLLLWWPNASTNRRCSCSSDVIECFVDFVQLVVLCCRLIWLADVPQRLSAWQHAKQSTPSVYVVSFVSFSLLFFLFFL